MGKIGWAAIYAKREAVECMNSCNDLNGIYTLIDTTASKRKEFTLGKYASFSLIDLSLFYIFDSLASM